MSQNSFENTQLLSTRYEQENKESIYIIKTNGIKCEALLFIPVRYVPNLKIAFHQRWYAFSRMYGVVTPRS
jgi:hypothetical protein